MEAKTKREKIQEVRDKPLESLRKVERIARHVLRNTYGIDIENLAVDIWLEIWQKSKPLCYTQVKNRCIDEIRKRMRKTEVSADPSLLNSKPSLDEEAPGKLSDIDRRIEIDSLMKCPHLSAYQHRLIFLHFYKDMTCGEIASSLRVDRSTISKEIRSALTTIRLWQEKRL